MMTFGAFKEHYVFRPLQTIVIDRPFELDGNEMNLVALTYEENAYSLWVIDILSDEIGEAENAEDAIEPCEQTNRDLLMRRDATWIRLIESIEVGKCTISFDGASAEPLSINGSQALHQLQYFIERGVEMARWDNVELSKMRLCRHNNSKSTPMATLDLKDEEIKLNLRRYQKNVKVFYEYNVAYNIEKPVKLNYYNPFEEKEETFYVHKFETYDLQKYLNSLENNEKLTDILEEQLREVKEKMMNFFENLKARNVSLVLMTYEAERVLAFQSKAYLDRKIERSSSQSSIGFIFSPDEKFGEFGKQLFIASFQEVPNDHIETIEFELHSISKSYKEEHMSILPPGI